VTLLWITKSYRPFRTDGDDAGREGILFRLGDPTEVHFYAKGRKATREEIDASVASGIHFLTEPAEAQGQAAVADLRRLRGLFDGLVEKACA
jgi:hypothetical protein